MVRRISIGIGDYKVSESDKEILVAYGLGSCIGLTMYDPHRKVGGLLHIMLPYVMSSNNNSNKAKFADTGIPLLVQELCNLGANIRNTKIKIAGGAKMFSAKSPNPVFDIGERNVEAVKKTLSKLGLEVHSEDTGSNYGRTMELSMANGKVVVRTFGKGEREL